MLCFWNVCRISMNLLKFEQGALNNSPNRWIPLINRTINSRSKQSYVSNTGSSKKTGYSAGSGLRSIAQGSADQAKSAVSNQHAAGKQAAYVAQVINEWTLYSVECK